MLTRTMKVSWGVPSPFRFLRAVPRGLAALPSYVARRHVSRPGGRPEQEVRTYYLLPTQWSLHFVMTEREWQNFKERVKGAIPDWARCPLCPKRCKATDLDEIWEYDHQDRVKRFSGAQFICRGCHWLKSPTWRMETWTKAAEGRLPAPSEPPHIIDCLGWTEEQVEALRRRDLEEHGLQRQQLAHIQVEVQAGEAIVRPWEVDLTLLGQYGYSAQEIAELESRMRDLAWRRLLGR